MSIDASNVVITSQYEDPDAGEIVVEQDGVVISRTPLPPERVNEIAIRKSLVNQMTRLQDVITDMNAVQSATIGNVAAASQAIKTTSRAVEDLARAMKRTVRLIAGMLDDVN